VPTQLPRKLLFFFGSLAFASVLMGVAFDWMWPEALKDPPDKGQHDFPALPDLVLLPCCWAMASTGFIGAKLDKIACMR
jgi:hypothetical protein